jgi:hypothetical protein
MSDFSKLFADPYTSMSLERLEKQAQAVVGAEKAYRDASKYDPVLWAEYQKTKQTLTADPSHVASCVLALITAARGRKRRPAPGAGCCKARHHGALPP